MHHFSHNCHAASHIMRLASISISAGLGHWILRQAVHSVVALRETASLALQRRCSGAAELQQSPAPAVRAKRRVRTQAPISRTEPVRVARGG